MRKFRVESTHPENLADGSMAAPGDEVEVDEKHEHNRRLIDEGRLVRPDDKPEGEPTGDTDLTGEE